MRVYPRMLNGGASAVGRPNPSSAANAHVKATQLAHGGRCNKCEGRNGLFSALTRTASKCMTYLLN